MLRPLPVRSAYKSPFPLFLLPEEESRRPYEVPGDVKEEEDDSPLFRRRQTTHFTRFRRRQHTGGQSLLRPPLVRSVSLSVKGKSGKFRRPVPSPSLLHKKRPRPQGPGHRESGSKSQGTRALCTEINPTDGAAVSGRVHCDTAAIGETRSGSNGTVAFRMNCPLKSVTSI